MMYILINTLVYNGMDVVKYYQNILYLTSRQLFISRKYISTRKQLPNIYFEQEIDFSTYIMHSKK